MLTAGADALLPVYAQMPVRAVSGAGSWIVDDEGVRWLDAYGGHAVASTGHSHPDVVRAIAEQAARLLFYSTVLPHPNREALAAVIARLSPDPLDRVFFCNSGAEANENAMHVARKVTGRQRVVSVSGGWHGRTVATLAVPYFADWVAIDLVEDGGSLRRIAVSHVDPARAAWPTRTAISREPSTSTSIRS